MPNSARLLTSVPPEHQARMSALAAAQGISVSKLLAKLVWSAVKENPDARIRRLTAASTDNTAPAEKYTLRLMGADAARLEGRAQARGLTASGYVAQVLRAHLRANPPMPYGEFQELKRVINELAGLRGALTQIANGGGSAELLEASTRHSVMQLLPALKRIRDDVQNMLDVNSKSWEAPDA